MRKLGDDSAAMLRWRITAVVEAYECLLTRTDAKLIIYPDVGGAFRPSLRFPMRGLDF